MAPGVLEVRVLDLFSGIGGFSLGLERAGMTTVAFCEIDPYCQAVLRKHWPDVPIYGDIKELDGRQISADLVCGGFPCQPYSVAGKRRGKEDDRHLWPEMCRVIGQVRPTWVIGENVAGIIRMELDQVLSDLENLGYSTRAFVIPACAADAPHRRDRAWIVAHTNVGRWDTQPLPSSECFDGENNHDPDKSGSRSDSRILAYTNGAQREGRRISGRTYQEHANSGSGCRWNPEPNVGRVANGIPSRMDRLKSLGNAVVPQIPEIIGRAIMSTKP